MVKFLQKLGRDTRGATAVEYGLILALIFFAMVGALQSFGSVATDTWNTVATAVVDASGG